MDTGGASFPRYSTSFVGREREVAELLRRVGNNRFVGLIGPGGVGKTRLAAQVMPGLRQLFEDGVAAVDLVGAVTPTEFRARVAGGIGVRDADAATAEDLTDALRGRRTLLLLDGCELLDSDCLLTVQDLLEASESLSILATSRRAIHVDGGLLVALPPLMVPPTDFELPEAGMHPDQVAPYETVQAFVERARQSNPSFGLTPVPPIDFELPAVGLGPADVAPYEAVQLFVDRARLVRPEFGLTHENAQSVATLCRRLDGLPLAVELAASWVRALSVDQIIRRMETSADFPRAGTTNIAPRHRTLSSLVAGTFDLCAPAEQTLWARMTVFHESFDLPAVEGVCGGAPLHETDLLDTIAALVDQSVVVVDDSSGESRYRLLRITREYGATKLGDADHLRARHRNHFDQRMSDYARRWSGPGQLRLLTQVSSDYANIVAAIDWGLDQPETVRASARMAADLWVFWFATGRLTEGRSVLSRVAAATLLDSAAPERVRTLYYNSYLSLLQGEVRSAAKLRDIASASRLAEDREPLARGLDLQLDAMIRMGLGDDTDPTDLLDRALATFTHAEGSRAVVQLMDTIGVSILLAALRGDSDRATALGGRGLAASDETGDVLWRAYMEYALGVDAWIQGSFARARTRALAGLRASPDQLLVTHCIELLAWCASSQDDHPLAARLFGAADRRWRLLGGHFSGFRGISEHRDRCLAATRNAQTAEAFATAYGSGLRLSVDEIAADAAQHHDSGHASTAHAAGAGSPLTARQHEVAVLVARGLSNREIAETLTISTRTAESHVDHILTKLNLSNRSQLVAWLLSRQGPVRPATDVSPGTFP